MSGSRNTNSSAFVMASSDYPIKFDSEVSESTNNPNVRVSGYVVGLSTEYEYSVQLHCLIV